jgi:Skp family chaperone for outer membrane proteins
MTSLNDIISQLKFELGKEEYDRTRVLSLVEKIEPLAARDWARIKKLERKMEAFADRNPEEIETSLKELESLKTELDKARQLIEDKDRQIESITNERTERETALAQSLASEKAAVARLLLDAGLSAELSRYLST